MRAALDASVALAWSFPDEESDFAQRLFDWLGEDGSLVAPFIWQFEVANALVARQRHGRLNESQVARARALLKELPLSFAELSLDEVLSDVAALASSHSLSAYDAAYLHVALREGIPLATLDAKLRAASEAVGCEVLGHASW